MTHLHKAITFFSWGLLAAVLIHLCFKWQSMPEITGVHFDSSGNFDVYASKKYIAYPFIVGIVFMILLHFGDMAAKKVRLGVKMSAKGEGILRELIRILLDMNKLFISFMAGFWVELVIYQHKMIEPVVTAGMLLLFVMFLTVCISVPILKLLYPVIEN
ncbi:MAG: hypothetical protein E7495_12280 [Ruminococcus flavefaciens]|jgi:hypothetical protein|nr:hypothetical protein [Ruminococcus flavefaciens]